ncbi:hypothetical protein O6H91_Y118300 [Diphasiastrum complanatum]|nr:hypothetical protein O6H91_Y379400 [Diphasiastrum complanatum]KAJ7295538.1 hypothetical protein O6H91_Y181900 [Diphasiastrum complanatum]KAJ7295539.1 hypothetical protein O6H91_Y181900 [Diphasiastrum complanatum]KAJ7296510.1 hypothetical protein O6H91_Y118300 [Diphasiastrum complanatum]
MAFGVRSTGEDVTKDVDASDLTAIVTGGTSGIGAESVRVLALRGARVFLVGRNLEAASKVKEDILHNIPQAKVEVLEGDLSSLASVKNCANDFLALKCPLNILINNAGILASPYQLSKDGIEMQFATNHVGHFLLTYLLMDKMKETAQESGIEGRIVNVSSTGHKLFAPKGGIAFDTINNEANYGPWKAYGQSKLANILHANELTRQFKEEGVNITANSLHPGGINTNLFRHLARYKGVIAIASFLGNFIGLKTVPQGAATQCFLALNPKAKGVSGKYFVDCSEVKPSKYATDPDLAKRLWDFSIGLTSQYLI